LAADFPALGRAGILLGRENFEFSFGFNDRLGGGREGFDRGLRRNWSDEGDGGGGFRSGLLHGDERDGLLDLGWCFDDSDGSGLGCERVFVLGLVVNDLNGGRLVGAGGGVLVCSGGWGRRAWALTARQA